MKKILYLIFFVTMFLSINKFAYAGYLSDKVWGTKECSKYSTKTLSGLNDYVRCKKGLKPEDKSIFKSLKWKKNNEEEFDSSIPCDQYSSKTFTALAKKMKCNRLKKK